MADPVRLVVRQGRRSHDHDELRIQTNLLDLDACQLPAVFGALAAHCGLDPVPMRMAVAKPFKDSVDPRYPALSTLIRSARRDWVTWGDKLVAEVRRQLGKGKLLPMTPQNERLLLELLRDHEVAIVAKITGRDIGHGHLDKLIRRGVVSKSVRNLSHLEAAFKLGLKLEPLGIHPVIGMTPPPLEDVVRQLVSVKLAPNERRAMEAVKRRGAVYMRRPAAQAIGEVERILTEEELQHVRGAISGSIEAREGLARAGSRMRDALHGHPSLQNDVDRVIRTEMVNAMCTGSYVKLKSAAEEAGMEDPWVFKFTSPDACVDCHRIWGPPGDPKRYRLSYVEQREAAGGNFRKPRSQWGPVVGTVHPNCTEGSLQIHNARLIESIQKTTADLLETYGA